MIDFSGFDRADAVLPALQTIDHDPYAHPLMNVSAELYRSLGDYPRGLCSSAGRLPWLEHRTCISMFNSRNTWFNPTSCSLRRIRQLRQLYNDFAEMESLHYDILTAGYFPPNPGRVPRLRR